MGRFYSYRHVIGFAETNLTGNVYYSNHIQWQGRCREMFLRDHAPDILESLAADLALVTLHCSCDYLSELEAFDEVLLEMRLEKLVQNRIGLSFEYWKLPEEGRVLAARGRQEIACMRRDTNGLTPTPVPISLRSALEPYGGEASRQP